MSAMRGLVAAPERIDRLSVECGYCHRDVDLPDKNQRLLAQQRQADQTHALAKEHLNLTWALQTRIMVVIVSITVVTMAIVFYTVLFRGAP